MQREEVDMLLVTRLQDIHYLTGWQGTANDVPAGCIIAQDERPHLLLSDIHAGASSSDPILANISTFVDDDPEAWHPSHSPGFWKRMIGLISEHGKSSGMIGLQQEWLSVRDFERLKAGLPGAGFKDFSASLWKLRQIKDAAEIDAIAQAARIAEIGIRTALEIVSPGKTESEASIEIESAMRSAGGQLKGIRAAVLSSQRNASSSSALPTSARINTTKPAIVDITVSYSGYFAEIARTLHVGSPTGQQKEAFACALSTSDLLQEKMKPGIEISEAVEYAIQALGKKCSLGQSTQPLGSSIGLDLREPPHILLNNHTALREGMVFSVRPSFHSDSGFVKIADIFYLDHDGCKSLTGLARETM
jgi:Xaa-Pro aminopeptidase